MDHAKKLVELMGATQMEYREPGSFEELAQVTKRCHDLSQKLEARGMDQVERVAEEYARLLAQAVQAEAREKHGVADVAAIREILSQGWETYSREVWDRQVELIKAEAAKAGLDNDDRAALMDTLDEFRDRMLDILSTEAARLKLVPLENMSEVSLALTEMIKEDVDVDQVSGS